MTKRERQKCCYPVTEHSNQQAWHNELAPILGGGHSSSSRRSADIRVGGKQQLLKFQAEKAAANYQNK